MTSGEGASSLESCYCTEESHTAEDEYTKQVCGATAGSDMKIQTVFDVPVLAGCLGLEESSTNLDKQKRENVMSSISNVIAEVLGGRSDAGCRFEYTEELIELKCEVVTVTTDFGSAGGIVNAPVGLQTCYQIVGGIAAGRRLEGYLYGARQLRERTTGAALSYTVRKASQEQAEMSNKYFQPMFMQQLLNSRLQDANSLVSVTAVGGLVVTTLTESCPENKALPPNARYFSADSCKCTAGWERDPSGCKQCGIGRYKSIVSDDEACKTCGLGRTTLKLGLNSSTECFCEAGKATLGGGRTCQPCPKGQFCPLDDMDEPKDCPRGSVTLDKGKSDASDCLCRAGYGIEPSNPDICTLCTNGTYKATVGNDYCTPCPQRMSSGRGATTRGECYCNRGFYLADPNSSLPCEECMMDGVVCEGGVDPLTGEHILPYAKPGYFLTGGASAVACPQLLDGTEICLGGGTSRTAPCEGNCSECAEGHDGFVCHNCQIGWTRNTALDRCRHCDAYLTYGAWSLIANLNLAIITHSLFAHVQTALAILALQGAKGLHSALIRLLQNWFLSMFVINQVNFNQVDMWGDEQMRRHHEGESRFENVNFKTTVPHEFTGWTRSIFLADLYTSQPTEWLGCLAEYFIQDEQEAQWWKHVVPAIYHAVYPLLLIFWTIVIDLILVYVYWDCFKQFGLVSPSQYSLMHTAIKQEMLEPVTNVIFELSRYRGVPTRSLRAVAQTPSHALLVLAEVFENRQSTETRAKKVLHMIRLALLDLNRHRLQEDSQTHSFDNEDPSMMLVYEHPIARQAMMRCLMRLPSYMYAQALQTPSLFVTEVLKEVDTMGDTLGEVLRASLHYNDFELIADKIDLSHDITQQVWRILVAPLIQLSKDERSQLFANRGSMAYDAIMRRVGTGTGDAMLLAKSRRSLLFEIQHMYEHSDEHVGEDLAERVAGVTFNILVEAASVIGLNLDGEAADPEQGASIRSALRQPQRPQSGVAAPVFNVRERMKTLTRMRMTRPLDGSLALYDTLANGSDLTVAPDRVWQAIQTVLERTSDLLEGATLQLWLSYFQVMKEINDEVDLIFRPSRADRVSYKADSSPEDTSQTWAPPTKEQKSAAADKLFQLLEYDIVCGQIAPFEVHAAAKRGSYERLLRKAAAACQQVG
eukprot:TRINITY_DN13042_c0_g2_i2.p1 TRINITY_DN13042_c0_g2~~TRINITY_DN13042_c0_g2_i2.p1  ORF type:complete len:1343 (-),score=211.66 TRINITY_DN13042_c0_g2_i2:101-3559(-)